jgi:hypothetical protein
MTASVRTRPLAAPLVLGALGLGLFGPFSPVAAREIKLTVYNQDLALIRDTRSFDLTDGRNEVRVTDVAGRLDPTSVLLSGRGLRVAEQNFEYDLAGTERILERYLDQPLTVVMEGGNAHSGRLVSVEPASLVLITNDATVSLSREQVERIEFPELPGGLTTRPTLVWTLFSEGGGKRDATLSYLTGGMQWHAEYVALVNEADNALELSAWVSLENSSGATYEDAMLQLVAGDIHRAVRESPEAMAMDGVRMSMKAPAFQEESFFEYHLYTLDEPVTVKDRQTKQVTLFPTAAVGTVEKTYRYRGGERPIVLLSFVNAKKNGIGMALPRGKVRVYKADSRGGAQLVGEDTIDHTPRDEEVEMTLGQVFDVAVERKVLDMRQLGPRVSEQEIEVEIRNHKDTAITVIVEERVWGDWEILEATHEWKKESAYEVRFTVPVAADGTSTLRFKVRSQT